jgi:hypothetical protein
MSPLGITASLRGAPGEAHGAIEDLACAVRKLGERHAADHDVLHMSRTLGLKLDEATHALAVHGERHGRSLDDVEVRAELPAFLAPKASRASTTRCSTTPRPRCCSATPRRRWPRPGGAQFGHKFCSERFPKSRCRFLNGHGLARSSGTARARQIASRVRRAMALESLVEAS